MKVRFDDIDINTKLAPAEAIDIRSASQLMDRTLANRNRGSNGIALPWSKLAGLCALRPGEVVLLGGYSGHFKSTISAQMAYHALRAGNKVGIASLELPAEYVIEQMSEFASGRSDAPEQWMRKFGEWCDNKLHVYDVVDSITPDQAVQMIIAMAEIFHCKLIVLDALMMLGASADNATEQAFTQTLASLAKRYNVTLLLIHHVRKPQGAEGEMTPPGKYDFIGSSHITNIASTIIIVWHDKKKHYEKSSGYDVDDSKPDMLFSVVKQRFFSFEGTVGLWQHGRTRAFCDSIHRKINITEEVSTRGTIMGS